MEEGVVVVVFISPFNVSQFVMNFGRWHVAVELINARMQLQVGRTAKCVEDKSRKVLVLDLLVWMWLVSLA